MANQSIFNAFERMWQHIIAALSEKSDKTHNHDDDYLKLSGGTVDGYLEVKDVLVTEQELRVGDSTEIYDGSLRINGTSGKSTLIGGSIAFSGTNDYGPIVSKYETTGVELTDNTATTKVEPGVVILALAGDDPTRVYAQDKMLYVNDEKVALQSEIQENFIAEFGVTTFADLESAYNSGKTLYVVNGNNIGCLTTAMPTIGYIFTSGPICYTCFNTDNWVEAPLIDPVVGAKASVNGAAGLVPAPSAGDQNKYLKGDGTWGDASAIFVAEYGVTTVAEIKAAYDAGKVLFCNMYDAYGPLFSTDGSTQFEFMIGADVVYVISDNNEWSTREYIFTPPDDFGNDGHGGFTPMPGSDDMNKFLRGDGIWADINVPDITYSQTDLTAGTSPLATGSLYLVYE